MVPLCVHVNTACAWYGITGCQDHLSGCLSVCLSFSPFVRVSVCLSITYICVPIYTVYLYKINTLMDLYSL